MYTKSLTVLAILPTMVCCIATNTVVANPRVRMASVCPDGVKIFLNPDKVHETYQQLAVVHAHGHVWDTGPRVLQALREKAAELGANGIILTEWQYSRNWSSLRGKGAEGSALAVYIPGDSARVHTVCSPICTKGVAVFLSPDKAPTEYREVAIIDPTDRSPSDVDRMKSYRSLAAVFGANAIIYHWIDRPDTPRRMLGTYPASRDGSAKVLAAYIPGDTTRVRAACQRKQ